MRTKGVATFTLDTGTCPKWLFERMVKLGQAMTEIIIEEYGPDEYIKRLADPVWFQALGTVLAFDWNASGLTTILTAALKEALRGHEQSWGIFICGGKGATSRKTPEQITQWAHQTLFSEEKTQTLIYNSKMCAKIDNSLLQDGFQLYHHCFLFTKNGSWTVIQQGMNQQTKSARRYHWFSDNIDDLINEPHTGIVSNNRLKALNLTAQQSESNRMVTVDLLQSNYTTVMKDITLLRKYTTPLNSMASFIHNQSEEQLTFLELAPLEFSYHSVKYEDFSKSAYLEKILAQVFDQKPASYEEFVAIKGVGPKTVRALALVAELLYGAKASYEDPARYSFAHGGKDGSPYFVDRQTYDQTISLMRKITQRAKIDLSEKQKIERRLSDFGA